MLWCVCFDLCDENFFTCVLILYNQLIKNLPRADSAAWDSYTNQARPTCFEGTRSAVLREIYSWYEGSDGQTQIYVLEGLAGIGKSTVARTVAEEAYERIWLGVSFFFSRREDDRKSAKLFFGTVAFQLSQYSEEVSVHVGEALERKPDASGKQLQDQLRYSLFKVAKINLPSSLSSMLSMNATNKMPSDSSHFYSKKFRI